MERLVDKNVMSIIGVMNMMVALQEEVDKLKGRQTNLEDDVTTLKATNLNAEA